MQISEDIIPMVPFSSEPLPAVDFFGTFTRLRDNDRFGLFVGLDQTLRQIDLERARGSVPERKGCPTRPRRISLSRSERPET